MGLEIRVFDSEESPLGRSLNDGQDRFFSTALAHARKSPQRFRLLAQVDPVAGASFGEAERPDLRSEWTMLESLAIGPAERGKWDQLFSALGKAKSFQALQIREA